MKKLFGDRDFLRELFSIALPLAMQSVITMVVNMIDSIMIGSLGDIALSSVTISGQFPWLCMTASMGISNAGLIIASQAWGNNRPDKVKSMIAFCLRCSIVVGIVAFLLSYTFPGQIISIYSNDPGIIAAGTVYLKIMSTACLLQSVSLVLVTMLRSAGLNKLGMYSSMVACFVNMAMNYVLIFGHFGFPAMGVKGAAVATVISRICEFAVIIFVLLRDELLHFRLPDLFLKTEKGQRQDFFRIGTPTIISEMTATLNVSAAAMITGRVSSYYIAANSVVHSIWTISSLFMFGIGVGASVIIGHAVGAGNNEKAEEYSHYLIHIAIAIGITGAILTQVLAPVITSFYNVSPEAIATAGQLKYAASIAVFFLAIQQVTNKGILRGAGQASVVTKVDLSTAWLVNIPVGYLVALVLHLPPFWIYLSLRLDYMIKSLWGLNRLKKGNWIVRLNVD